MLKTIYLLVASICAILSIYSLISDNDMLIPLLQFFLGVTILIMGIESLRSKKKATGIICVVSSLFIFTSLFIKYY
ncbi:MULTISPECIES: DUF3953 domain-containing protein [Bacillus]|uniref:DUF3953 domain-containing protein n=2 Tax=Bacillus TaxID=1386 RepID=A0A0M3R8Y0_9BACI|nr:MULTISPECIES: DUF3953 domain-containing protein [Bacillus]ALC80466.1 hypothetical protein AM592_01855 [Bacillus gobiensis]MBP1083528.1 hypothetical protein [Bacillus capparidis]MED1094726.1 DUF3953 domain-containing protein [Bacillus capparidis]